MPLLPDLWAVLAADTDYLSWDVNFSLKLRKALSIQSALEPTHLRRICSPESEGGNASEK